MASLAEGRRAVLLALLPLVVACATPIGVKRVDPRTVHRQLTSNVLSTGRLSAPTHNVLQQRDLVGRFDDEPERALAELHGTVVAGRATADEVFALAELSFFHAEEVHERSHYLASAVYAYAFLFPDDAADSPEPADPRLRTAYDLYNRSLTAGFASADGSEVELRAGTFALPFGTLAVEFDRNDLRWGSRALVHFVPVAELEVRGMRTRYRWPGIGAPLAASTLPLRSDTGFQDFVQPWVKVPVTAVLRLDGGVRQQMAAGRVRGSLEIEAVSRTEAVEIDGRPVPLEVESTATLAYMLAESPVWQQEIRGFLTGVGVIDEKARLAALSPYRPGRIPVVFVHGTASSAGRWAEMMNELVNDRRLRGRFAFWLFSYNTGNPIPYSAMLLRESLRDAVERLDPRGTDPALRRMVVIGHSQGGLLAKMTAIESGSAFWDDISRVSIEEIALSDASRDLMRRTAFVHPLPFVRRLIFIATPQRGSYFAGNVLAHWLARFITLPLDLLRAGTDLVVRNQKALTFASMGHLPTAVDNMTPGNPFIRTLASISVAPGVATHSIIAVRRAGPVESGSDGVVAYQSAHVDGVESELVVRSGHSCQANPHTIEEVRRILLKHLADGQAEPTPRPTPAERSRQPSARELTPNGAPE